MTTDPRREKTPPAPRAGKLKRDIWRMVDGSWGAEVERNGVGVGLRHVSLPRAIWHVLTVRRPDEYATLGAYHEPRWTRQEIEPQRGELVTAAHLALAAMLVAAGWLGGPWALLAGGFGLLLLCIAVETAAR